MNNIKQLVTPTKLWNKNFLLLMLGMEFNYIGANLLKFVLPLYVLRETGNPALMGTVLAFSLIPLILFLPIGGISADRFSKRILLALMNMATAIAIVVYLGISSTIAIVPATIIFFLLFSAFESMITPTVEASMPVLVPKNDLVKANSVSWLLSILSTVGSPILGGFILERLGLTTVLYICIAFYVLATTVKLTLKIPHSKQEAVGSLLRTIVSDIKDGVFYVTKENTKIGKLILISGSVGLFFLPITSTTLPVLVSTYLEMGETFVGLANGVVMFGGTVGIILLGVLGEKANVTRIRPLLLVCCGLLAVTGLGVMWSTHAMLTYVVIIALFFMITGF